MGEAAPTVTDDTFNTEVLQSDLPVVVDFWAPWCGPCRQLSPILAEIAREHGEKIRIVTLNTDKNTVIPTTYNITALPTLAVYVKGELVKTVIGARSKPVLLRELSDWLS